MFTDPNTIGNILYVLQEDDAQGTLQDMDASASPLTKDELDRVKKGLEGGFGEIWTEVMQAAIQNVLDDRP